MEVVKLSTNTPQVFEKVARYKRVFVDELSRYFEIKDYGRGVKKITYMEFLLPANLKGDATRKEMVYDEEKKAITCIVLPEYKNVVKININKFGLYIAEYYLSISAQFVELRIKN